MIADNGITVSTDIASVPDASLDESASAQAHGVAVFCLVDAAKGRANSLYVLFYYLGGAAGITLSGHAYTNWGWGGVAALNGGVLLLPFAIGMMERRQPG